jgi:hypothetical protein
VSSDSARAHSAPASRLVMTLVRASPHRTQNDLADYCRWYLLESGLRAALGFSSYPFLHSRRSPSCCIPQPNMPCSGSCCPPSFTLPLAALPPRPSHPSPTHAPCHTARLLGRHTSFRATFGMGRVDRSSFNHFNCCFGNHYLRHEEDSCHTQSSKEEDCRKCRNERRKLL